MLATQTIVHEAGHFSHADAEHVSRVAACRDGGRQVVLDLRHARETTTSAFARLVLLRRELLQSGRDLFLSGLTDRAAGLYEINRLQGVLPLAS